MTTEEYNKALNTGMADHSKVGAAEGLLHRQRLLNPEHDVEEHAARAKQDQKLGTRLARMLPYLAIMIGGWILAAELGEWLGLGEKIEDYPAWYNWLGFGIPVVVTIVLRIFFSVIFAGLFWLGILGWIAYIIFF
ncbi:MAG: hypothetical protein EA357_07850 [Micavibrio sp.]|nr:MAG: hypothetical protein EA357_07850 [Micavibrio sp.]